MIAKTLSDHSIMCGYGVGGEAAVEELLRQGIAETAIVVIDCDPGRVARAIARGVTAMMGDATTNATLKAACIQRARALLVSAGRDDSAALIVLSARQLNPEIPISVRAVENEDLLRQAGASSVINPVSLGGHLLARSSTHRGAVDYILDLAAADGRVALRERPATEREVGHSLRAITTSPGARLSRRDRLIGFWEDAAESIEAGDSIIEIVPVSHDWAVAQPLP